MLNEHQIAFITCVNDETEYAECRNYLNRLYVPEGYSTDMIGIREAPSMTAGYNAGMKSSDAKYKVYLHQDVFVKNVNFIADLLSVFDCDERVGLLGVIGKKTWGAKASELTLWDTGKVIDNVSPLSFAVPSRENGFEEVKAADGLLMATQYDLPWREDVFDGWDFYDLSQCMEFMKAGYKVIVPWQEDVWCYHDAPCASLTAYFKYYRLFVREYVGVAGFFPQEDRMDWNAYEEEREKANIREMLGKRVEELFTLGEKEELRNLFKDSVLQKELHFREYCSIVAIDLIEERKQSKRRFWADGMSAAQLICKLRALKHALKRIEYGADELEKEWILENFSKYAVWNVCDRYIMYKDGIRRCLGMYMEHGKTVLDMN